MQRISYIRHRRQSYLPYVQGLTYAHFAAYIGGVSYNWKGSLYSTSTLAVSLSHTHTYIILLSCTFTHTHSHTQIHNKHLDKIRFGPTQPVDQKVATSGTQTAFHENQEVSSTKLQSLWVASSNKCNWQSQK